MAEKIISIKLSDGDTISVHMDAEAFEDAVRGDGLLVRVPTDDDANRTWVNPAHIVQAYERDLRAGPGFTVID